MFIVRQLVTVAEQFNSSRLHKCCLRSLDLSQTDGTCSVIQLSQRRDS